MAEAQTVIIDLQTKGVDDVESNLERVAQAAAGANENVQELGKSTDQAFDTGKKRTDKLGKSLESAEHATHSFNNALSILGLEDTWLNNLAHGVADLFNFESNIRAGVEGAKHFGEATGLAGKAQKAFNVILNASPIFLIVTAIAAVTAGVYALTQALDFQADAQETLNEVTAAAQDAAADDLIQLRLLTQTVGDLSKSEESRAEALAQLKDTSDAFADITLENVNLQEDLAVATELATKQIMQQAKVEAAKSMLIDLEKERLDLVREIANDEFTFQELLLGNTLDQMKQLTDLNKITQEQALLTDIILENSEAQLEADGKLRRSRQKTNEVTQEGNELERINIDYLQAQHDIKVELGVDSPTIQDVIAANTAEIEGLKTLAGGYQELTVQTEDTATARIESLKGLGYELLENREAIGDAISGVGALFGEESKQAFKIQKGVSVAQTTISTIEGAIAAYKSLAGIPYVGPALGAAAAAGVTASGLAAVRQIQSQTFNGGGSGGGGSLNLPSGSSASQGFLVPSTPTAADVPQPEPVQAYVIGQQITNQQALDSELKLRSTL